jgi:hypothetical protein
MNKTYYTKNNQVIRNPTAYAKTGAPMYESKRASKDINAPTSIYKLDLADGKKYMTQHFTGNGSQVTKKFKPKTVKVVDKVPGFFSNKAEQAHTDKYINRYGYNNVRGGKYVNSNTLQPSNFDAKTSSTSKNT